MLLGDDDRERYNEFAAACEYGNFLQSWEWGELKAATGWQPYRIAVEEEGRICAAVQILSRPVPGIRKCLFYSPRGPLYSLRRPELFQAILAEINDLARRHGALAYKIDPAIAADNSDYVGMLVEHGFAPAAVAASGFGGTQPRYVMQVDVSPDEDDIIAKFKSKWRYNVRLAERSGVTVSSENSREQVGTFHDLLLETAARDGFKVRAQSYFDDIYDLFIAPEKGGLFLAHFEGKLIAGAIVLTLGKRAWYVYGASSNEHRDKMPNHLMQWEMMRWARARGCEVYDMRGVANAEDKQSPLYGLNRFKRGFAAEYVEYIGEWDLVYSPTWHRLFTAAEPAAHKLRLLIAKLRG